MFKRSNANKLCSGKCGYVITGCDFLPDPIFFQQYTSTKSISSHGCSTVLLVSHHLLCIDKAAYDSRTLSEKAARATSWTRDLASSGVHATRSRLLPAALSFCAPAYRLCFDFNCYLNSLCSTAITKRQSLHFQSEPSPDGRMINELTRSLPALLPSRCLVTDTSCVDVIGTFSQTPCTTGTWMHEFCPDN
jgi:hypothetical protein